MNVAARLEQMADPGGVLISGKIYDEIEGKIERRFESRGEQQVKNLARPVRVYALAGAMPSTEEPKPLPLPDKPSIAVLPFTNMSGDPSRSISPMVWLRTSSRRFPASGGSSLSPGTHRSRTKVARWT